MKTPSWFLKKNLIAYALWPLSLVYYLISKIVYLIRKNQQSKTSNQKSIVICIGNIFAGGVGKTPIVATVAKKLKAPVVMRGYRGGDEATMLKNQGLDVYVGDRNKNIRRIKKPTIILDDGFQNPTIKKDISILVFDAALGLGNGFMLPAGPLREPMSAVHRTDAVIVIRQKDEGGRMKFIDKIKKYNKPIFYAINKTIVPSSFILHPLSFIAFAGIGYPNKFFDALPTRPEKTFSYPDHYQYTDCDLKKLLSYGLPLLTTEKDWVRLPKWAQKKIEFARLETTIENKFWTWIRKQI